MKIHISASDGDPNDIILQHLICVNVPAYLFPELKGLML